MSKLEWDKVGERTYETGVDRGVLYVPDGPAVSWNGLTEVTEDRTREVKSYFMDGIKYLDHHVPGAFSGTLKAFTYPDELEELMGNMEFVPGVWAHDQRASIFNLSYRTRVGNDLEGVDHGYKIHILYNLTASASNVSFPTIGENVEPNQFEWKLSGVPAQMFGIRPTAHISIDSRQVSPEFLELVEELLYGSEEVDPSLPNPVDLLGLAEAA